MQERPHEEEWTESQHVELGRSESAEREPEPQRASARETRDVGAHTGKENETRSEDRESVVVHIGTDEGHLRPEPEDHSCKRRECRSLRPQPAGRETRRSGRDRDTKRAPKTCPGHL